MARNTRPELVRLMTDNNNPDNDAFICNMKGIADV